MFLDVNIPGYLYVCFLNLIVLSVIMFHVCCLNISNSNCGGLAGEGQYLPNELGACA